MMTVFQIKKIIVRILLKKRIKLKKRRTLFSDVRRSMFNLLVSWYIKEFLEIVKFISLHGVLFEMCMNLIRH